VTSSRWWSALAFLAPFALFCFSIVPDVGYWDTAEMETVPYIFGIAHPTGFPTFVIAGWIFSHVVPFGTVAYRLSLMSAVAMAFAAWCAYATVVELGEDEPVAAAAALLFVAGDIVWTRGTRTEVHAFAVAFAALVLWQAVRFHREGSTRALSTAALGYGLALATHGIATLLAPGLAMLVAPRIRDVGLRAILRAAVLVVAPLALYLYIPLRSAQLFAARVDPTLALGIPPGRPFWDNFHPATLPEFLRYMGGGEGSQVGEGFSRMFEWANYSDVWLRFSQTALRELGPFAIFFAVIGLALAFKRDAWLTVSFVVACGLCVPYGLLYPEADQDRYLMTAFWGIAVFAAYGAGRSLSGYFDDSKALGRAAAAVLISAAAFGLIWTNRATFGQRNDPGARNFINKVVAATPDGSILVANWTFATPLGYAAFVDHTLGKRIVVTAFSADYASFYPEWLRTRRIYLINEPEWQDTQYEQTIVANDPSVIEVRRK
jgi:hypothetical protein